MCKRQPAARIASGGRMSEQDEEAGLRCIVYSSSCIVTPYESDLLLILNQARRNNSRNGITGLLSFDGQNFLQLLEGPEAIVRATVQRISTDSRHYGVKMILDVPITARRFAAWGNGVCCPGSQVFCGYRGFSTTKRRVQRGTHQRAGGVGQERAHRLTLILAGTGRSGRHSLQAFYVSSVVRSRNRELSIRRWHRQ